MASPIVKSIRPFVGSKDFETSRSFYTSMGFTETPISKDMSLFAMGDFGFYLQDYYVKKWMDNMMLFLEIENLAYYRNFLITQNITQTKGVRLSEINTEAWGHVFFVHDPDGVLWQIGNFNSK